MVVKKNRICKQTWFFSVVLVCIGAFLIWKSHYGYIFNDEPFMITLGHRLLKGDHLFVNEWNTAQLIGIFNAPVIWIYTVIKGSLEGFVLFCRTVYVIWWMFVGIVLYRRTKQYGWISIVAVSVFLLYSPHDIMSLNYNAMSLSLLVLFVSYFLTEGRTSFDYLNGVVLALSVLAYPTLISVYFVYFFAVLIKNALKINVNTKITRMLSWKVFIRITIAASLIAVVFFCFLLSGGIDNVIIALRTIFSFSGGNKPSIIGLAVLLLDIFPRQTIFGSLLLIVSFFDKRRKKRAFLYICAQIVLFVISLVSALKDIYYFNVIMIPLAFVGLQAYILTEKKDHLLFSSLVVVGVVLSLCGYFSSDTGLKAFSNGFVIIDIASVIFIYQFYKESEKSVENITACKALAICLSCIMVLQVGSEFYIRVVRSFRDELYPQLNTKIDSGVAKGIITTEERTDYYNKVYEDVLNIRKQTEDNQELNFLSLSMFPSIYLDMDYCYGTFSSWTYTKNTLDFDSLNRKLTLYYENNPTKTADVIYINDYDTGSLEKITCIDFGQYREISLKTGKAYIHKAIE